MRNIVYIRAAEKLNQLGHKERARRLVRHAHKIEMTKGAPMVTFDVDGEYTVTAAVFVDKYSIEPDTRQPGLRLDITPTDPTYLERWLDSDVGDGLNLVVNWKNKKVMWIDLWGEQKHVKCRCADRASANKLRDIIEEALAFHEGVETDALAVMRTQKPTANDLY
jgi:hypothetical protein